MSSPALVAQAARTSSEADVRALALAKVKATKAFNDLLYAKTDGMTDDELIDREIALVAARSTMHAAISAFDKAV